MGTDIRVFDAGHHEVVVKERGSDGDGNGGDDEAGDEQDGELREQ
ncbi:hypothetical protein M2260_003626 [Rhodococcus erythropolis]|nr:hypothetical protein [Rhodococcus erythropolis]MCW2428718.1 hypothetical protein [Rhodococcus erythropolis]